MKLLAFPRRLISKAMKKLFADKLCFWRNSSVTEEALARSSQHPALAAYFTAVRGARLPLRFQARLNARIAETAETVTAFRRLLAPTGLAAAAALSAWLIFEMAYPAAEIHPDDALIMAHAPEVAAALSDSQQNDALHFLKLVDDEDAL